MTKKANPNDIIRLAMELTRIGRSDCRSFNAAMRSQFPHISPHALREARQNAKILLAIQQVTSRRNKYDEGK